ncbi:MAG: carbon storage regulator [Planctomycetia bacterium]|nr:carbon storage regulator [Planctomycetia bacterium]
MLVLSRKIGERILIGDEIAVTVVRISQGTVRIGIEAPRNLSVVREEVVLSENSELMESQVKISLPQTVSFSNQTPTG